MVNKNTQPKRIVRSDGVATTVHKKTEEVPATRIGGLPNYAPTAPFSSPNIKISTDNPYISVDDLALRAWQLEWAARDGKLDDTDATKKAKKEVLALRDLLVASGFTGGSDFDMPGRDGSDKKWQWFAGQGC